MASAGATIWLPDICTESFFMELSTMITRAQQQWNTRATQFDSSEFFARRMEEYKRTYEGQIFHDWAQNRNNGLPTDVVLLDFSTAFDSVPHERLSLKLQAYGIRDPLLWCIRSFLTNRHQRVVLQGTYSSWTSVLSGVPHGMELGPILLLIYINDITQNTRTLKYYRTIWIHLSSGALNSS